MPRGLARCGVLASGRCDDLAGRERSLAGGRADGQSWGVRWCSGIFLVGFLLAVSRGQAAGPWPSVEGALAGELKLFSQVPNFTLPWKVTLSPAPDGGQAFSFILDGAGARVQAAGQVDLATGNGSWRIDEARIDAAVWFAACAPRLAPAFSGMTAQGTVTVAGSGILRQGQPVGRVRVTWRDGSLQQAEQGWTLAGIAFSGEFELDGTAARPVSTAPFELTVQTITTTRFGARNGFVNARLNEQGALSVTAARVEIAGGEVTTDPFEAPLSPLMVNALLRISRVGLQDIVLLVPAAGLDDARGRIDGVVRLKWDKALGIQLGVGHLAIRDDEPAIVRLTPAPGLLTGHVPQYFDLLPTWLGPLSRWARQVDPAYGNMQSVELGQSELRVKTLDVLLTPEGDERGRSATVRLVAQPTMPDSVVKEVTFDVNVAGPLNAVLKLGIDQKFTLGVH